MTEQIMIKIEEIVEYKKILDNIKEDYNDKFFKDPVYKGAVLHYLYLIADSCISLADLKICREALGKLNDISRYIISRKIIKSLMFLMFLFF